MDLFMDLLFLCPSLFLAGVIDGIVGGGGIISLPAYIMVGLPLNVAYGCNKMQSCIGTSASLVRYAKSGFVDVKIALLCVISAILGSFLSTRIIIALDDSIKNIIIVIFMIFIIILTFLANRIKSGDKTKIEIDYKTVLLCLVIGLILGLYDGFFGPGGGTVALMLFSIIFKYDMRVGNGNGKIIIVVSNFIALISYIIHGYVLYRIAIPATIANVIGSYLGASLAVKKGTGIVKGFLIVVVIILVVQSAIKLF